jgi:curved DNA-binding protein CbpA
VDDPYEVLGLGPQASDEEIRHRYLDLVRKHPPDRDPERFAAVRRAYDKLRDPLRRLQARLFEPETGDSLEKIIAEVRRHAQSRRIPTDKLLSLAERR